MKTFVIPFAVPRNSSLFKPTVKMCNYSFKLFICSIKLLDFITNFSIFKKPLYKTRSVFFHTLKKIYLTIGRIWVG